MTCPDYVRLRLEPSADHPLVGVVVSDLLTDRADVGPAFGRLVHPTVTGVLSSGEVATINLALALWNGNRESCVADLFLMDAEHQQRACDAICAKFLYSTEE